MNTLCDTGGNVRRFIHLRYSLEALHDNEHVIDADAEQQEWQNRMHRSVEKSHVVTHPVGRKESLTDYGDAHERKVYPLLQRVAPTNHHDHVDRDQRHAAKQHGHVAVDHLVQHVLIAAQRHRVDLHARR